MKYSSKLDTNIFKHIGQLKSKIEELELKIDEMNIKYQEDIKTTRCHLSRVKNNEILSDDFILRGRKYNDLSPEKAFHYYSQDDINFIILDISDKSFQAQVEFPEAINIPIDELEFRAERELPSKVAPILVISENGVNSIVACEKLFQLGYYNVNNISGGYKFWPKESELGEVIDDRFDLTA